MIGQLLFLQQFFISNMNLSYQYCLLSLGSFILALNTAIAANANDIKIQKNLLFPLDFTKNSTVYLSKSNHDSHSNSSREYTFKAPGNKTLNNNKQLIAIEGYRVEVYGSAAELLLQVKDIEPGAFIKDNTIQVGIFSQQKNAEDLVRKLTIKGLWARIVAQ